MGREIRRVPLGWEHPKREYDRIVRGRYQGRYQIVDAFVPMYKGSYEESAANWDRDYTLWQKDEHPDQILYGNSIKESSFTDYAGQRPDPDDYMPVWSEEECKGWCVYETVSLGTPVTPVFEKPEDLIDYLVEHGDFWDQQRREEKCSIMNCDPWSREAATSFVVSEGWAPSLIMTGGLAMRGVDLVPDTT